MVDFSMLEFAKDYGREVEKVYYALLKEKPQFIEGITVPLIELVEEGTIISTDNKETWPELLVEYWINYHNEELVEEVSSAPFEERAEILAEHDRLIAKESRALQQALKDTAHLATLDDYQD